MIPSPLNRVRIIENADQRRQRPGQLHGKYGSDSNQRNGCRQERTNQRFLEDDLVLTPPHGWMKEVERLRIRCR